MFRPCYESSALYIDHARIGRRNRYEQFRVEPLSQSFVQHNASVPNLPAEYQYHTAHRIITRICCEFLQGNNPQLPIVTAICPSG